MRKLHFLLYMLFLVSSLGTGKAQNRSGSDSVTVVLTNDKKLDLISYLANTKGENILVELKFKDPDFSFELQKDNRKLSVNCKPNHYKTTATYESIDPKRKSSSSGKREVTFKKKQSDTQLQEMVICFYYQKRSEGYKLLKTLVNGTNLITEEDYSQIRFIKIHSETINIITTANTNEN